MENTYLQGTAVANPELFLTFEETELPIKNISVNQLHVTI